MTTDTTSPEQPISEELAITFPTLTEKPPGYVKLAMRNMVRKRGKSLQHFFLSTIGLLVLFVGLAYITR
jgi:Protein of unknown function (DUF3285)